MADLDFTKRRLVEQHEEDMEQLMMLKKQLEKKVSVINTDLHENQTKHIKNNKSQQSIYN